MGLRPPAVAYFAPRPTAWRYVEVVIGCRGRGYGRPRSRRQRDRPVLPCRDQPPRMQQPALRSARQRAISLTTPRCVTGWVLACPPGGRPGP